MNYFSKQVNECTSTSAFILSFNGAYWRYFFAKFLNFPNGVTML